MLSDVIATFESQPAAVAAFKAFANACAALAVRDPDNAASLLVLAVAARHYVEDYEGQPVSLADVSAGREVLLGHARSVAASLGGGAEARLRAANAVAVRHLADHPF